MTNCTVVRLFCIFFSLLLTSSTLSAAPYSDYDRIDMNAEDSEPTDTQEDAKLMNYLLGRKDILTDIIDLYKMLLQQESLDNQAGIHQMERRARGPQLRLRFGKRADDFEHFVMKSAQAANERPPSLRLRFGKRSEDTPISAYLNGLPSQREN